MAADAGIPLDEEPSSPFLSSPPGKIRGGLFVEFRPIGAGLSPWAKTPGLKFPRYQGLDTPLRLRLNSGDKIIGPSQAYSLIIIKSPSDKKRHLPEIFKVPIGKFPISAIQE
jgi:hypothetical protein